MPLRQKGRVLGLQSVRHVVAFKRLLAIEECRTDIGTQFQRQNPQCRAATNHS